MKRTEFKRKVPPPRAAKQYEGANPSAPRAPLPALLMAPRITLRPIKKEQAIQSEAYMRLVRAMFCAHCGRRPKSQFCHSDQGKGMGIKTDCRRGWPGCAECHFMIGSTGTFKREHRRVLEADYAAKTRAQILADGTWPAGLPHWRDE